jgi:uncharacterized phage-like protein YoqJ
MVTGHRPQKLGSNYKFKELVEFAKVWLTIIDPQHVIHGGAVGFDLAIAAAAYKLGIPYTMAIPFPAQPNKWQSNDYRIWLKAKEKAARVEIISPDLQPGASRSDYGKILHKRNKWMIDEVHTFNNGLVLALWDGTPKGGTYSAIYAAKAIGLPIINIWNQYINYRHLWL